MIFSSVQQTTIFEMGALLLGMSALIIAIFGRSANRFKKCAALNRSEIRLYFEIRKHLRNGHLLLAQCSYGEILAHRQKSKYMTINSKRADMVIVDVRFQPIAIIEYQGRGHYGSTIMSWLSTKKRDKTKRRAAAEAGIKFVEVFPNDGSQEIRKLVEGVYADL